MKRYCYFIFVITVIIFFLLNSQITLEGSLSGLILWFQTIVPTLLPFMILSSILINLHGEALLNKILAPFTTKLFGLSPAGNYVFFIGLFCGYPLGAKTASELLKEERISLSEAQYLMNFCNNISPIFVIGFICNTLLNNSKTIPFALIILYAIPLIIGLLTKKHYIGAKAENVSCSKNQSTQTDLIAILDNAIISSAQTAIKLGGYIILFSIFCTIINKSHILSEELKTFATILLEVTNGCKICVGSPFLFTNNITLPTLFACATFGGLAGIAQTSGMIQNTPLSLKQYILFRAICSAMVFIISFLILLML